MIYFNGRALEDVAPVKIVDVLVSPIKLEAVARQRPIRFGADFVRMTGGSRTAAITFALLTNEPDTRQRQLVEITRWARSDEPGRLTLPGHDGVYLEAICTALPEPSLRQWWESKLRIVFTTYDNPYWTSIAEKSARCGDAFTALGDAPPMMRIVNTATSALTNITYGNGAQSMTFSTIPAGDMEIDLNRQTAAVNGASIMRYYPLTGATFLQPKLGAQTISGAGTVKWRERWE